ncbi:hypothetical protein EV645_4844 [Kribbella rubisoli]|uniref:site-specific DNA-methyltransferase (adenine-specific) n=1 Tax=Kribbella rubisoli TaxID=3075929 RepID=A0A4Q7WUA0_9ACTN|nr:hypothetical protein [Kribbella rubisoli]RZU13984.1 hypothetical protein EV645_4844 [Kribbella rubisoli]
MRLTADKVVTWIDASAPAGVTPEKVYLGPDPFGLGGFQVAMGKAVTAPSRQALRDLFTARKGRTQIQLVVAVIHDGTVHLFGPDPQAQPIELPLEQAERQLQSVLSEPDQIAATERLAGFRKASDSMGVAGFTNSGLFASHHITSNVPKRSDWEALGNRAGSLLSRRGKQLVEALGFGTLPGPNGTMLLSIGGHPPHAVAVLLDDSEQFDAKTQRFQLSPVAFGLAVASRAEVPWLVVLRKDQIRLYPGRDGVGVGSKGQAETYFEVDLSTIDSEYAALLPLIFSAEALAADGTADELLSDSSRYASELGARLRERIYDEIVPPVAVEVAQRLAKHAAVPLDADGLSLAYRVTLRILFRLLFQAYAEDRGLLPSGRNEGFDANSLKTNARRLMDSESDAFGDSSTIWFDLVQVWNAIDRGNQQWQIPSYNGGLFSTDSDRSPEGALIKKIELPDSVLGPALKSLLIDMNNDGVLGPVDFRSLSVREFGTIYEGLLDSSLSRADEDLTVDSRGAWVPAKPGEHVYSPAGSVYFHTASGERKATGSYFTPKVVVDHLIERSIVPSLTAHLKTIAVYLASGDASAAARQFFDFRVADLAMGSGHFLVAAVDKIEALMRTFLTEHTVPGVTEELLRLAVVARDALGTDDVAKSQVDEVGLLRRQVARRCIYGLDVNPMAVELARLALWIHTFVPGLPMSNLDHGLVNANSLTGIGTINEAVDALVGASESFTAAPMAESSPDGEDALFDNPAALFDGLASGSKVSGYQQWLRSVVTDYLEQARPILVDVANASEGTKAEVQLAAEMLGRARAAAEPARKILDAAVAIRLGAWSTSITRPEHLGRLTDSDEPGILVAPLHPAHMPFLFPEVFVRPNPGFDVLLGNPPWEELQVEEPKFWLRLRPGLLGLKPAELKAEVKRLREERPDLLRELERESAVVADMRKVLLAGPYPGLGTGDIDLYSAFAWRFWQLCRTAGSVGVVIPRSQINSAGGADWRKAVFEHAKVEIVTLLNNRQWVFPIHPQWTVALVTLTKESSDGGAIKLAGPFFNQQEFMAGKDSMGATTYATLAAASSGAAVPNLSDAASVPIFTKMREAPRLDARRPGWDFRPVAEMHATNDRPTFDSGLGEGDDRIPVVGGAGFNIWEPTTGEVYAWADPKKVEDALFGKRKNQTRLTRSAFYGLPASVVNDRSSLSFHQARIVFRDIARATDTRTCIAALIPPETVCQNSAPYLLQVDGDGKEASYLLGVLSSIPLDWYARRYVELHLNLHIFKGLPIPPYEPSSAICARTVRIAARLAAVDDRFEDWAATVGVPVGSVKTHVEKADLVAELDALVGLLYDLTEEQVEHVFATFHRGWNYESRLDAVLKHYRAWKGQT